MVASEVLLIVLMILTTRTFHGMKVIVALRDTHCVAEAVFEEIDIFAIEVVVSFKQGWIHANGTHVASGHTGVVHAVVAPRTILRHEACEVSAVEA